MPSPHHPWIPAVVYPHEDGGGYDTEEMRWQHLPPQVWQSGDSRTASGSAGMTLWRCTGSIRLRGYGTREIRGLDTRLRGYDTE